MPEAFDLAVIDRIYNYIPGWEIPKIDDSAYNNNFGLITDYMSEALHYLFVHDSDYMGIVNTRLKKGDNIEGRDNRALQKTISGFIKLLFPTGQPTDEEFDEIVEYAIEGRRRVKEQLNKRKPDEEYARINMSYINKDGQKVVVYCPESKYSVATQNPRKEINVSVITEPVREKPEESTIVDSEVTPIHIDENPIVSAPEILENEPKEKTIDVQYGDTGYGYDELFTEYLKGASIVMLEEPYLAHGFQMTNLVRFVELLVKVGDCKVFRLVTKPGETLEESAIISDSLQKLKNTLDDMDEVNMTFEYEFDENSHDRYIRTSNDWDITLGRGLHFYQNMNPNRDSKNFFQMGTYDLSLRPCLKARFTFMKRNATE